MLLSVSPPVIGYATFSKTEAELMNKLSHTHLLQYALEFIEPNTVACVLHDTEVDISEPVDCWALPIAKALLHLHNNHIVHGNLSPKSITRQGNKYKLMDYTALKVTKQQQVFREFVTRDDYASDVYAYGKLLSGSRWEELSAVCCGDRRNRPNFQEIVNALENDIPVTRLRRSFDTLRSCGLWRQNSVFDPYVT